jgi:hypothetical protein
LDDFPGVLSGEGRLASSGGVLEQLEGGTDLQRGLREEAAQRLCRLFGFG